MSIFKPLQEVIDGHPFPNDEADLAKYYGPPITPDMIRDAEANLGVKLPAAYVELLQSQNGGFLRRTWLDVPERPDLDEISLSELPGVGYVHGIDSEFGSNYMTEEWEYPSGLVYLAGDGHTGVCLDYRQCGPQGEPTIAWIDLEMDPIGDHQIAPNFQALITLIEETKERHNDEEDD